MRQQKEWLKRCRIGLILLFMLSLVVHLAHLDSFDWKKKKGPLMGLCDRYKCGTFCEDYFKLRDQVTDALREPACRFAASRTKTILLSWYSDSQNARPHSPFSAPRWWLLNSSNGAVWSKVFYTRAPWQQVLREEGKKSLEESTFLTWVPVWVIAAFLLKQKPQN